MEVRYLLTSGGCMEPPSGAVPRLGLPVILSGLKLQHLRSHYHSQLPPIHLRTACESMTSSYRSPQHKHLPRYGTLLCLCPKQWCMPLSHDQLLGHKWDVSRLGDSHVSSLTEVDHIMKATAFSCSQRAWCTPDGMGTACARRCLKPPCSL